MVRRLVLNFQWELASGQEWGGRTCFEAQIYDGDMLLNKIHVIKPGYGELG